MLISFSQPGCCQFHVSQAAKCTFQAAGSIGHFHLSEMYSCRLFQVKLFQHYVLNHGHFSWPTTKKYHVNSTDSRHFQMVGSSAIPRIHLFLGVCRLGRHIMIAETSAVWLERFFVASDPCFGVSLLYPLLRSILFFWAPWAPFSMSSCNTWPSDAMGTQGMVLVKEKGCIQTIENQEVRSASMHVIYKNKKDWLIILMFFTSIRKASNHRNSRHIIYLSGRNQGKFQGTPIVRPPIPILLPYHSHKNPLKCGNGVGPAYGKGVPLLGVPGEILVRLSSIFWGCKPSFPWLPRAITCTLAGRTKPALDQTQIRISGIVYPMLWFDTILYQITLKPNPFCLLFVFSTRSLTMAFAQVTQKKSNPQQIWIYKARIRSVSLSFSQHLKLWRAIMKLYEIAITFQFDNTCTWIASIIRENLHIIM